MINSKELLDNAINISKENNRIWAAANELSLESNCIYIDFPDEVLSSIIPVGEKLDKIEFLLDRKMNKVSCTLENNLLGFKPSMNLTECELNDEEVLAMIDDVYDQIANNRVYRCHDPIKLRQNMETDGDVVVHSSVDSAVDKVNNYKNNIKALREEIDTIGKEFAKSYRELCNKELSTVYNDVFNNEMDKCKLFEKDLLISEAKELEIGFLVENLAIACAIVKEASFYDLENINYSTMYGIRESKMAYSDVKDVLSRLNESMDTIVDVADKEDAIDTMIDNIKKDNNSILDKSNSIMANIYLHNVEVPKILDNKFDDNETQIDACIDRYNNISESVTDKGWYNILENIENDKPYLSIDKVKELDMDVEEDDMVEVKKTHIFPKEDINGAREFLANEPDELKKKLHHLLKMSIERKRLEDVKCDDTASYKEKVMANVDLYKVLNKMSHLQQKIYHFDKKLKFLRMIVLKSIGCKDDEVNTVLTKCDDHAKVTDVIHSSNDKIEEKKGIEFI